MFLPHVHSFRALAIIFILAGHVLGPVGVNRNVWQGRLQYSLLQNGTVYFVFIAGFLFQHLSGKFRFPDYLKRKALNVGLPYLLISIPKITYDALGNRGLFSPDHPAHWPTLWQNVSWAYLTGNHIMGPLWFIPMISIFYLLAPLFLWLDRREIPYRLLPLLLVGSVFIHRPDYLGSTLQSAVHFLPVYLFGMWFSRNRDRILAWHERWLPALLALVALVVFLEVGYLKNGGSIYSSSMFSAEARLPDLNVVQKLLLCGIFLTALRRWATNLHARLHYLADASFGVYFLHDYAIVLLHFILRMLPGPRSVEVPLMVAAVLVLCGGLLWLSRRIFGRTSRLIFGY